MSPIKGLVPWEYEVSGGYTARGYYTEPSGKPVLHFIHGNGFSGMCYEHFLAGIQNEVDLFISDAQGHGNSDEGGEYRGWNCSAFHFEEVWSHFSSKWGKVPKIACGHSYGGAMTTLLMARNPALFDFGILLDPGYPTPFIVVMASILDFFGLTKHSKMVKQAKIRGTYWKDRKEAWEYFYQRGIFKDWQNACVESYIDHALEHHEDESYTLKCPPRIEAAIFSSAPQSLWPSIKGIRKPMTMFYGDQTYPFILSSRKYVRRLNPYYDFVEMPGGHCFMQQEPEQTAEEVLRKIRLQLNRS